MTPNTESGHPGYSARRAKVGEKALVGSHRRGRFSCVLLAELSNGQRPSGAQQITSAPEPDWHAAGAIAGILTASPATAQPGSFLCRTRLPGTRSKGVLDPHTVNDGAIVEVLGEDACTSGACRGGDDEGVPVRQRMHGVQVHCPSK
jgi:hypothetical protein